jgi:hypothetical protein
MDKNDRTAPRGENSESSGKGIDVANPAFAAERPSLSDSRQSTERAGEAGIKEPSANALPERPGVGASPNNIGRLKSEQFAHPTESGRVASITEEPMQVTYEAARAYSSAASHEQSSSTSIGQDSLSSSHARGDVERPSLSAPPRGSREGAPAFDTDLSTDGSADSVITDAVQKEPVNIQAPSKKEPGQRYYIGEHGKHAAQDQRTGGENIQGHHPMQDKWARENVIGYETDTAPSQLLETGKGTEHTQITNAQRANRPKNGDWGSKSYSDARVEAVQQYDDANLLTDEKEGTTALLESDGYFFEIGDEVKVDPTTGTKTVTKNARFGEQLREAESKIASREATEQVAESVASSKTPAKADVPEVSARSDMPRSSDPVDAKAARTASDNPRLPTGDLPKERPKVDVATAAPNIDEAQPKIDTGSQAKTGSQGSKPPGGLGVLGEVAGAALTGLNVVHMAKEISAGKDPIDVLWNTPLHESNIVPTLPEGQQVWDQRTGNMGVVKVNESGGKYVEWGNPDT